LPVYGLLTFWGTLTHQLDMNADFAAYARYTQRAACATNVL
jgi:hypothetical protein